MDYGFGDFTKSLMYGMFGVGLAYSVANGLWTYTNSANETLDQWLSGKINGGA